MDNQSYPLVCLLIIILAAILAGANTINQIQNFLRTVFHLPNIDLEELALREAEEAAMEVLRQPDKIYELSPQNSYIRRLQHQIIQKYNLKSRSTGEEPNRRLTIYSS